MPISLTPRLSNSGLRRATAPSSVVQTGVKSFGWEKNRPQLSPSHLWKLIWPSVLSASKSGALAPIDKVIVTSSYLGFLKDPFDIGLSPHKRNGAAKRTISFFFARDRCYAILVTRNN